MKKYKIYIDVYNIILEVWIGGTEKDFCKEIKQLGEDLVEDGATGSYVEIYDKNHKARIIKRIIWSKNKNKYILYHEIFHAIIEILSYINIYLVKDTQERYIGTSQEPYAYLFEFLIREIDKILKKK